MSHISAYCRSQYIIIRCINTDNSNSYVEVVFKYYIFVQANREKNIRPLMMVTEESKTGVLTMICTTLISQLDDADYMISRFKSENFIISYLESDEENSLTRKLSLEW